MKKYVLLGGFVLTLGVLAYLPAQQIQNFPPPEGAPPASAPAPAAQGGALLPDDGPQVLAYGQMHEAFAQPTETKPSLPTIVAKQPPDPVPETPPEQKPDGDNVQWFAGYWSWDQDKSDFIWISGVYRNVPPNQQFVPGYWTQDGAGWKRVAGFYANAQQQDVTYHPEPPKSLDNGPNQPAPGPNAVYSPGYWYYAPNGWSWHPGAWVVMQPGLVWVPPHYRWTPCGYVLVGGYWDYPLEQRGLVFAPVYFPRNYWAGDPAWCYYPRSVVTVSFCMDSFFIGPCRHHYYFGAYYGPAWHNAGFVAWVDYGPRYHDPIYGYYRYEHREDPHWHATLVLTYNQRVSGHAAPPPKIINNTTYVVHNTVINNTTVVNKTVINNVNVKGPVQVVGVPGKPAPTIPKLNPVPAAEIQKQVVMNQKAQAAVQSRQKLEAQFAKQPGGPAAGKPINVSVNHLNLPPAPVSKTTTVKVPPTPALPGVTTSAKTTTPTTPANPPKTTTPTDPPKTTTPTIPPKTTTPTIPPKTTPTTPPKGGHTPPPPPEHKKDPPKVSISYYPPPPNPAPTHRPILSRPKVHRPRHEKVSRTNGSASLRRLQNLVATAQDAMSFRPK